MIKFKRAYDCISCIVVFIDETKIGIIITKKSGGVIQHLFEPFSHIRCFSANTMKTIGEKLEELNNE